MIRATATSEENATLATSLGGRLSRREPVETAWESKPIPCLLLPGAFHKTAGLFLNEVD